MHYAIAHNFQAISSRIGLLLTLTVAVVGGCECNPKDDAHSGGPGQPGQARGGQEAPNGDPFLPVLPSDPRFTQNPALLARLKASPHGYFRFVNRPFAQAVCELFHERVRTMPNVNLHGDAHLEQYTVTDAGVGLTDFDDSSFGPAVLDLVRFGASLKLAASERGLTDAFEPVFSAFLDGYRAALDDPDVERATAPFTERARAGFDRNRMTFLTWATGLMTPMSAPAAFQKGYDRYRALMESEHPDLATDYFEIVQSGRFQLGVGSALDEKYLIRAQGPSESSEDDVILEYKEVRDLSGIDCIHGTEGGGAFRILVSQSRIGQMPYRFLAQVPRERGDPPGARMYWVHEWAANYKELTIDEVEAQDGLAAIAFDVGVQLGKGHPRGIATPLDSQLRRAQRQLVEELEDELGQSALMLAQQVEEAFERFRKLADDDDRRSQ